MKRRSRSAANRNINRMMNVLVSDALLQRNDLAENGARQTRAIQNNVDMNNNLNVHFDDIPPVATANVAVPVMELFRLPEEGNVYDGPERAGDPARQGCSVNENSGHELSDDPDGLSESQRLESSEEDDFTENDFPTNNDDNQVPMNEHIYGEDHQDGQERQMSDEEILKELAKIACRNNMSHKCLRDVARLFKRSGRPKLKTDPRVILKTKTTTVGDANFVHLGLVKGLLLKISKGVLRTQQENETAKLILQINMDGVPLYKSKVLQLWPILVRVLNCKDAKPFAVSLFVGSSKPPSIESFTRPFLNEIKQLMENGITYEGSNYDVEIRHFCCDAPARQLIKAIAGHCGFEACERCTQRGIYLKEYKCMTFPELERITLRTDRSFRNKCHKKHHTGTSPFEELNVDMIRSFPLDYLHLVLLGVFKRLLQIWTGTWNKKRIAHRLGKHQLNEINRRLQSLRFSYPREFHRKTSSLAYVNSFKAVEFRHLLLYTGPVVFKGIISPEKYQHFLYLHIGIRILASEKQIFGENDIQIAKDCLKYFVDQFGKLYGKNHLVYNVHSLIHLADECAVHGPLDRFSCFPFETYLGKLKKLIRSSNKPLAQMARRISELDYSAGLESDVPPSIFNARESHGTILQNLKSNTNSDSFYLTENGLVIKVLGVNKKFLHGKELRRLTSLYKEPFPSRTACIFKSGGLKAESHMWPIEQIRLAKKCWVMPLPGPRKRYAVFPFLHAEG